MMESLKEIIAKEVKRPKELLKKTKGEVEWIIAFVQELQKEAKRYLAEFMGGSLLAAKAAKTKANLLEQKEHLQILIEVLAQTLGEEWDAVREDWPEEYINNLREINGIIQKLLTNYIPHYGKIVQECNIDDDTPREEKIKRIGQYLGRIINGDGFASENLSVTSMSRK